MTALFSQVKNEKPYMVELRRHFHQYPEGSLEEFKTAIKIEEELTKLGIACKRVGETGVLGIIKGGLKNDVSAEKVIVLRADIDALAIQEESDVPYRSRNDGFMHACGHDAHIASLLGAAKVLNANRSSFAGEVRLAFQQDEEIGEGAKYFIEAGVLKDAGRVFAVHMAPDIETGKMDLTCGPRCASSDYFRVTVRGKSTHVSTPHKGADALFAACQIVTSIQGIVARRTSPLDTVLIGVGTLRAGTTYNIVAEEAVLEGTVRTFKPRLREEIQSLINETSAHVSAIFGSECKIEWKKNASVLENDETACKETALVAAAIFGNDSVLIDKKPSLGGDDFAEFLLAVPGVYANVGCAFPGKPRLSLHNCRFDLDEEALVYAAGMYACYSAWYLSDAFSKPQS